MRRGILFLIGMFFGTTVFAWLGEKPQLSFPAVKPKTFHTKRIQSKSRQASEYFLAVETAPVNIVNRYDPSVIEPPLEKIEETAFAPNETKTTEILEPKIPNLTYKNGQVAIEEQDPTEIKQEFQRTYVSQNKYLSMMETVDAGLQSDEVLTEPLPDEENFTEEESLPPLLGVEEDSPTEEVAETDDDFTLDFADEDLSEAPVVEEKLEKTLATKVDEFEVESEKEQEIIEDNKIKILQMKVAFDKNTTALTGKNVHLISSFAQVALNNPTNAVEISISEKTMGTLKAKQKSAERLALVSRILKDHGLSEDRIKPVLTTRDADSFVLRITNKDAYSGYQVKGDQFFDLINKSVSVQEW
ncbi:MAG: hypothetical protein ACTSUM_00860 [Alphaproteobacteria bacterium]|nr:MAG: hypothetical protein B6I23_00840 [Rickettsiaceae bacterium 4572_127]